MIGWTHLFYHPLMKSCIFVDIKNERFYTEAIKLLFLLLFFLKKKNEKGKHCNMKMAIE